jgi:hypothetical protein
MFYKHTISKYGIYAITPPITFNSLSFNSLIPFEEELVYSMYYINNFFYKLMEIEKSYASYAGYIVKHTIGKGG